MSKSTKIKALAITANLLPPLGVCAWQFPIIVSRTSSTISFAAMLVIVLFMCFAKDELKQKIASPTAFTMSIIFVVLGWIGISLGEQFLIIGSTTVASSLASTPLYIWYKHEKEGNEQLKAIEIIKGLVNKNETDIEKH